MYESGQAGRSNPKYVQLCSEDTGLSRGVANSVCAFAASWLPLHVTFMPRILKPSAASVEACIEALANGKAIVYPTETVYGLGVDATNRKAVAALFRIKKRDPSKPTSIAVASVAEARKMAYFNKSARILAKKFLPGPLTLVLKARKKMPVVASDGTIGVRVPDNSFTKVLLSKFGKPITATSANVAGAKSASRPSQIDDELLEMVEIIINDSKTRYGIGSTVIDLTNSEPKILREGSIKPQYIERVLKVAI